ncbi:hypothetical protein [Cobetia sp. 1CM21F]|uniref:hypothetical protein n=1 Tax=Cobetia sp. 1CM21F TaxID=2929163 RepID=UPI0020BE74E2|nr:hypothetical protein [Cobetia sp. 1CM21F]MCK8069800.1 hypothetical protein [Cobetia sp. 1CM21F]
MSEQTPPKGRPRGSRQARPTQREKREYLLILRERAMRGDVAAIQILLTLEA